MSLELAITKLADAIVFNAETNLKIAGLTAAKVSTVVEEPAEEEEAPAPAKKTPAKKAPTAAEKKAAEAAAKKAAAEADLDPDAREEDEEPEDEEERPAKKTPAKTAAKARKPDEIREDIRNMFEQMTELKPGSPAALLKKLGHTDDQDRGRLSAVPDDELEDVLKAAKARVEDLKELAEQAE